MGNNDIREALYKDQCTGPAGKIQLPAERITTLHGILFDLDPGLLAPGNALFEPADDPRAFLDNIRPVLGRHPLARHAQVRCSGTGLHLIVLLRPAVELRSEADQRHWAAVVRAAQSSLPIDPNMPGITALTRPAGAVNSAGGIVELLEEGQAIEPRAVEEFVARLARAPFKEVATVLLGDSRVSPCPVCGGEGSRLDVLDRVGLCYDGCGKVGLEELLNRVYLALPEGGRAPRRRGKAAGEAASDDSAGGGRRERKSASGRVAGKGEAD